MSSLQKSKRRRLLAARLLSRLLASLLALALLSAASAPPAGAVRSPMPTLPAVAAQGSTGSLESAASRAGQTGRKIAMSLIALGFAIAAVVLVFRRDFKEAAGVLAIGLLAIVLATPIGVNVLHDTVNSLFAGA